MQTPQTYTGNFLQKTKFNYYCHLHYYCYYYYAVIFCARGSFKNLGNYVQWRLQKWDS